MNLILLQERDFIAEDRVRLSDERLDHIRNILRSRVGDTIQVGLLNQNLGTGEITKLSDQSLEIEVVLNQKPPAALDVHLLLALPRPPVLRRILLSATVLGIKRITLFHSQRVEKTYWKSRVMKEEALAKVLLDGLQQARDTVMPDLRLRRYFKPFVEKDLPKIIAGSRAFLAHPEAGSQIPVKLKTPVTVAIGPEGGFIPYEVDQFKALGFQTVRLTDRILNVETAVMYFMARMAASMST